MSYTTIDLFDMSHEEAIKVVMEDLGCPRRFAEEHIGFIFTGGDVVALAPDEESAYEADPEGFLKERQRQIYLAEESN